MNDDAPHELPDHTSDGHIIWPAAHNVVLTGFMGTGKSTVGRSLAARLGYDFVDTDDLIEAEHGSIASIFESLGEARFRELEHEVAVGLGSTNSTVIATGGRLMLDDRNVAVLSRSGRVCCLVASPDEIVERLTSDSGRHARPLLQVDDPRRRIEDLLAERNDGYRRFLRISADRRSPDTIAAEIAGALGKPSQTREGEPTVVVGAALLPLLPQLVGDVGHLVGEAAAWFRPQVELVEGGCVVAIGQTGDDALDADVYVPVSVTEDDRAIHARFVVYDAAVVQAWSPGMVAWTDVIDRVNEQVRGGPSRP